MNFVPFLAHLALLVFSGDPNWTLLLPPAADHVPMLVGHVVV